MRSLTPLAREGRLVIPNAVARELRRRQDSIREWVDRHTECRLPETNENMVQLPRIMSGYADFIGSSGGADPSVIAMGLYYRDTYTVVTDDGGIQAVCYREALAFLTSAAFRRLENV
jgi:rRNA maturation endonuclease Nob1